MKKCCFYTFIILCSILISGRLFCNPDVQILSLGLKSNSTRTAVLAGLFSQHLSNILRTVNSFSLIQNDELSIQLQNSGQTGDREVTAFIKRAGIPILVRGSLEDHGSYITLRIYALSYDVPYNGSIIANHEVEFPVLSGTTTRELSYIMEEHTGLFLSKLLEIYTFPHKVKIKNNSIVSGGKTLPDGSFPLYRLNHSTDSLTELSYSGTVTVSVKNPSIEENISDGEYAVLQSFSKESQKLSDFYYGRKREIIFPQVTLENKVVTVLATPFLSIISPIGTPISYYLTSDYSGLGLWALQNSPYLYFATRGYLNSPDSLKDSHKSVSSFDKSIHSYSYYYFLCSGMALYADAVGHYASTQAKNYIPAQPFSGDPDIALYLSVVGNGGGHFYKGYRGWGYFFFHADNLLTLSSLYFLSNEEKYTSEGYRTVKADKTTGYIFLSAAIGTRILEIFHCSTLPFNIQNGKEIDHRVEVVPDFSPDTDEGGAYLGISVSKGL